MHEHNLENILQNVARKGQEDPIPENQEDGNIRKAIRRVIRNRITDLKKKKTNARQLKLFDTNEKISGIYLRR